MLELRKELRMSGFGRGGETEQLTEKEREELQARRRTYMERMKAIDERYPPATLSDFADHIDHAVKVAGIDHVGIGTDFDGDRLYVTSVDREVRKGYLHLLRLADGELLKEVEVQEGDRFHPGGIALDRTTLWLPVAEYRRAGTSSIQRRHKGSLALLSSFQVEDHIGCVAAGRGRLAGGNWDSRQIYLWDLGGRLPGKKDNPSATACQDMKWIGSDLIASGNAAAAGGNIHWLDAESLQLRRRIRTGTTDRGVRYTNEGMAIRDGRLYLLPEDGPSRLFVLRLPPSWSGAAPSRRGP